MKPEYVIVEDSNSGYEFFYGLMKQNAHTVISAGGKSNIFSEILKNSNKNTLIIADGAAFGSEMDRVMKQVQRNKGIVLYLPESFEWLILRSGVIQAADLNTILQNPENFIESKKFFSWERFFSELLIAVTNDTYLKYTKRKLNEVYLHGDIADKIVGQMTGIEL